MYRGPEAEGIGVLQSKKTMYPTVYEEKGPVRPQYQSSPNGGASTFGLGNGATGSTVSTWHTAQSAQPNSQLGYIDCLYLDCLHQQASR